MNQDKLILTFNVKCHEKQSISVHPAQCFATFSFFYSFNHSTLFRFSLEIETYYTPDGGHQVSFLMSF